MFDGGGVGGWGCGVEEMVSYSRFQTKTNVLDFIGPICSLRVILIPLLDHHVFTKWPFLDFCRGLGRRWIRRGETEWDLDYIF